MNAQFSPMLQEAEKLYADSSDDQLRTIRDFMSRMSVLLREQTAALRREKTSALRY